MFTFNSAPFNAAAIQQSALTLTTELESKALRSNNVHKVWGTIRLDANKTEASYVAPVDFVVAIDISASMRVDSKLVRIFSVLLKPSRPSRLPLSFSSEHAQILSPALPFLCEFSFLSYIPIFII